MDKYSNLKLKYPASGYKDRWLNALPTGNGETGALVCGGLKEEAILINNANLWHWGEKSDLPNVSDTLKVVRDLIDQRDYFKANSLLSDTLKNKNYKTTLAFPVPLVDAIFNFTENCSFSQYSRNLNMETGEIEVGCNYGGKSFIRKVFVSRADNAVICEITSEKAIDFKVKLAFHNTYEMDSIKKYKEIEDSLKINSNGPYIYYSAKNDDGLDYGAVLKIIHTNGVVTNRDGGIIKIKQTNKTLIAVKTFCKSIKEIAFKNIKEELDSLNEDYNKLLNRHCLLHTPLFCETSIELKENKNFKEHCNEQLLLDAYDGEGSNELFTKLWKFGRYLLISGTKENGLPFPLYGLWHKSYELVWAQNMANINLQMIYWQTTTGGLIHLLKPVINYYSDMIEDFKINAKNLFGCRGIYIPAGSTPGIGTPNQVVPVIMNWISAAGWLSQNFYEYFIYTGDRVFFENKILPFMYEAALFYEDYMVLDENGYMKLYPSVSPENTPGNFMPEEFKEDMAHVMPSAINATLDFAVLKELLNNLIVSSNITGKYSDKICKWETMIKQIPPYKINNDGAICEWMYEDFKDYYNHRHMSHIYPVFPGKEFLEFDPDLIDAFEKAVNLHKLEGQTGWSITYMASMYARFYKGEKAISCLDILIKSCLLTNFFTLHNDWRNMGLTCDLENMAPIQLDANMGLVSAINEMLVFTSKDLIKILPACPKRFSKGCLSNFYFTTGKINMEWDIDKNVLDLEFIAIRDTYINIILPSYVSYDNVTINNNNCHVENNKMIISMNAGDKVNISNNIFKIKEYVTEIDFSKIQNVRN